MVKNKLKLWKTFCKSKDPCTWQKEKLSKAQENFYDENQQSSILPAFLCSCLLPRGDFFGNFFCVMGDFCHLTLQISSKKTHFYQSYFKYKSFFLFINGSFSIALCLSGCCNISNFSGNSNLGFLFLKFPFILWSGFLFILFFRHLVFLSFLFILKNQELGQLFQRAIPISTSALSAGWFPNGHLL